MPDPKRIDLRDVAAVVKASATNRLGRPLLRLYGLLIVIGILVVGASIAWMYLH